MAEGDCHAMNEVFRFGYLGYGAIYRRGHAACGVRRCSKGWTQRSWSLGVFEGRSGLDNATPWRILENDVLKQSRLPRSYSVIGSLCTEREAVDVREEELGIELGSEVPRRYPLWERPAPAACGVCLKCNREEVNRLWCYGSATMRHHLTCKFAVGLCDTVSIQLSCLFPFLACFQSRPLEDYF